MEVRLAADEVADVPRPRPSSRSCHELAYLPTARRAGRRRRRGGRTDAEDSWRPISRPGATRPRRFDHEGLRLPMEPPGASRRRRASISRRAFRFHGAPGGAARRTTEPSTTRRTRRRTPTARCSRAASAWSPATSRGPTSSTRSSAGGVRRQGQREPASAIPGLRLAPTCGGASSTGDGSLALAAEDGRDARDRRVQARADAFVREARGTDGRGGGRRDPTQPAR